MKFLIDMNLSPDWVEVFGCHGWQALHWTSVGDPRAADSTIIVLPRDICVDRENLPYHEDTKTQSL